MPNRNTFTGMAVAIIHSIKPTSTVEEPQRLSGRLIAIGDIHGCSVALSELLKIIEPHKDDVVVALGDYVSRGPDSCGALNQLIALQKQCQLIPLLGNHDAMMLDARRSQDGFRTWLQFKGASTLASYGSSGQIEAIPESHFEFLANCRDDFETDSHFFVHANYHPEKPLRAQDEQTRRWLSLRDSTPGVLHCSGKVAVVGHTPQPELLDIGHLICVDTGCCRGGWLTAIDLNSGRVWQSNQGRSARRYEHSLPCR